ncbi:cysteine desulfurase [Bradyrhizobium sp. ISRA443]|uniref:cysteine desulfurase family protein n=1 Tax=unclassified Bradyrhizobium TaxID=2631580 RepID=UPI00247B2609|nr:MULTISPECIES: cysteine desulfurase family protein [unclassified Bradyrhizobium]WGR92270.1 cysteine desulfurase [Bradyrhizobium sp. ISRA435]WGR96590.1 cysteine desulfurase [Bradyrhizobium sp. ISRA436]WGS03477.1 cysteine desulfurase [Bradyrhizobium sp. ISRA437]WGS10361.1 cysteine desulfurase [Bradyrhizobium sp. ISRA443]
MFERVYFDWNATTPLRPEAKAAMAAAWELSGNPSSVHSEGRKARRLVEDARAAVAKAVGGRPQDVVFSSGGTEANALALMPGLRRGTSAPVTRLLTSAVEHASVLAGGRFAPDVIGSIGVTRSGVVDLDDLRALLNDGPPALVSVMLANNETGAIHPVAEVAEIVHRAGGLLHVDAIQAFGKIPFDLASTQADLLSLSAHKIGGPKGVGALVLAEGVEGLEALLRGGGQELGRRAGTENVAGISGFGAAAKTAMAALKVDAARVRGLRDRLEHGLRQTPGLVVFSDDVQRLPNTVLFTAPGMRAETAVIGFDLSGVAVSSGSACSSGKVQPSHVLAAMGYRQELAQGAVRLSLGWSTNETDVDLALKAWRKLADTLVKGERRNTA